MIDGTRERVDDVVNELVFLQSENAALRAENERLKNQLHFLTTHKTIAAGIGGERIVSEVTNGILTAYAASFDITAANGATIEVKKAAPSKSEAGRPSARWQWGKVLGESGSKRFDFLLLVGEADERFQHLYRDPLSPFIAFCVPFSEVLSISTQGQQKTRIARVSTNPEGVRTSSGRRLYDEFQVTMPELADRFGIRG